MNLKIGFRLWVGLIAIVIGCIFWWPIESALTDNKIVAAAWTIMVAIATPVLVSFNIPRTALSQLYWRTQFRTAGQIVSLGSALAFIYYQWYLLTAYWLAQAPTVDSGLVSQQVIVALIGFVIVPALMFTVATFEDIEETIRQQRMVERYNLQSQADIAILRAKLLRAQVLAIKGFSNLLPDERKELKGYFEMLQQGVANDLRRATNQMQDRSNLMAMFDDGLPHNDDIRAIVDWHADAADQVAGLLEDKTGGQDALYEVIDDPEPEPEPEPARRRRRDRTGGRRR